MKKCFLIAVLVAFSKNIQSQEVIAAFDHHALAVKNVEVSVDFYKNILQLKPINTPVDNPLIKWFSLGNNLQIHLIQTEDLDIKTHKANHFSLHVKDIGEFVDYLQVKQIPFWDWVGNAQKIALRPDGVQQVYIQDPDGYWIEINDAKYN
ncbi:MAG: VOC family protein [Flavobacteriaceae bacterium]|nr:VOC family protein [Flavobacteriaceae bacterium]